MKYIINFLASYLLSMILFYFFLIRKNRISKKNKTINKNKIPVELKYIINRYNIKINKKNINKLLYYISLIGSLYITITYMIVINIKSVLIQLLVALIVLIALILLSNVIIKLITKKGNEENEQ